MPAKRNLTNMACVPMSDKEQRLALKRIALGDSWQQFADEIHGKIKDYEPTNPVRQACERALSYMEATAVDV